MFNDSRNLTGDGGGTPEGNYTVTNNPAGGTRSSRPVGAIVWRDADGDGWAALFNGVPNRIAYETTIDVVRGSEYLAPDVHGRLGAVQPRAALHRGRQHCVTDARLVQPRSRRGFERLYWDAPERHLTRARARPAWRCRSSSTSRPPTGGNDFGLDGVALRRVAPRAAAEADTDGDSVPDVVEGTLGRDTDRDGRPTSATPTTTATRSPPATSAPGNVSRDTDGDGTARSPRPRRRRRHRAHHRRAPQWRWTRNTDMVAGPTTSTPTTTTTPSRRHRAPARPTAGDPTATAARRTATSTATATATRPRRGGPDPHNPVDTDRDGARDFLDLDSDNDCIPTATPREAGAARTTRWLPR
jgi:hypothetical protein